LDPERKMAHFVKYWGNALAKKVCEDAEKIFKDRYFELHSRNLQQNTSKQAKTTNSGQPRKIRRLLSHLESDSEDDVSNSDHVSSSTHTHDSAKPWLKEFNKYLDSDDELNEMTLVQWWGINARRIPVWASLARDYMAIMASSVSSERAFSSAGITISKRRNRLKGDIVEAIQFIKCAASHNILYREEVLPSTEEDLLQADDGDSEWEDISEAGWDKKLGINDEDESDYE
ncbi:hypothetical protein H0H87_011077, partial [Tephrocybe sp. NHM501043]